MNSLNRDTKPNGWEQDFEKIGEQIIKGNSFDCKCCGEKSHRQYDTDMKVRELFCYEPLKKLFHQAILSAEEKVKQDFKEKVELWMATHDKLGKTFSTDDFINYITNENI